MPHDIDRRMLVGALTLTLPLAASVLPPGLRGANAQAAYPTRTINMIVPFPPGGQADLAARPISQALEKILGKPVIVDNRSGAGGAAGNSAAAKADPDGYNVLMTLSSVVVLPESDRLFGRKPAYELDQLAPVARVLADPTVLAVLTSSKYKTLADVVAEAKRRPGEIPYSSSGHYGATHVPIEMFANAADVRFLHVPYRGGGPALLGLIGNQVEMLASAPGPLKPFIEEGKVRVLASWSGKRTPELPDVPTFQELGYKDVEFYIWAGLFVPKATPDDVVTRLRTGMKEAMARPEVIKVFETAGSPPAYLDATDFTTFIAADAKRLIPAVQKIGKVE